MTTTTQTAIVTGAGRGLGAATATAFSETGFNVAALDLKAPVSCDGMAGITCDVSDAGSVAHAIDEVCRRFGRIDVLVNCAGIDHTYWIDEMTIAQFDQVIGVNLRGPFLTARAVWPIMARQGGGRIINVTSTAAIRAWSGASAYHASKFGLLGMSRGLGVEGRRDNIQVTAIIPGGMRTGFFERFADQGIPMPDPATLQDPADVAQTILFAATCPAGSIVQEIVVTPPDEPSWP
jgi:NAD(P)-dependent dehydrogenase (short-subunit alcohol dehydrogenase family)